MRKTSADSSQFYERIALSQNKATVLQKAESAEPADLVTPEEARVFMAESEIRDEGTLDLYVYHIILVRAFLLLKQILLTGNYAWARFIHIAL